MKLKQLPWLFLLCILSTASYALDPLIKKINSPQCSPCKMLSTGKVEDKGNRIKVTLNFQKETPPGSMLPFVQGATNMQCEALEKMGQKQLRFICIKGKETTP